MEDFLVRRAAQHFVSCFSFSFSVLTGFHSHGILLWSICSNVSRLLHFHQSVVLGNGRLPDELLYGRVGYLYSLVFINQQFQQEKIPIQYIQQVSHHLSSDLTKSTWPHILTQGTWLKWVMYDRQYVVLNMIKIHPFIRSINAPGLEKIKCDSFSLKCNISHSLKLLLSSAGVTKNMQTVKNISKIFVVYIQKQNKR